VLGIKMKTYNFHGYAWKFLFRNPLICIIRIYMKIEDGNDMCIRRIKEE